MTKQEFMQLEGKEQVRLMSTLTRNKLQNAQQIEIVKDWFIEMLESKHDIQQSGIGLISKEEARQMGYSLERNELEARELDREESRVGKRHCPKAQRYLHSKRINNAKFRGYAASEAPGHVPNKLEQDALDTFL